MWEGKQKETGTWSIWLGGSDAQAWDASPAFLFTSTVFPLSTSIAYSTSHAQPKQSVTLAASVTFASSTFPVIPASYTSHANPFYAYL